MKTPIPGLLSSLLLASISLAAWAAELPPGVMRIAGTPAPALQLEDLDGEPYDLAETGGHWRFVHFWASWCGPCRREMPSIQKMITLLEDSDIEFLVINTAETEDEVFTFLGIAAPELVKAVYRIETPDQGSSAATTSTGWGS